MNTLNRDVQLAIFSKMDMDARIKCGIVFKLRIPLNIKEHIEKAVCKPPESLVNLNTGRHITRRHLGHYTLEYNRNVRYIGHTVITPTTYGGFFIKYDLDLNRNEWILSFKNL